MNTELTTKKPPVEEGQLLSIIPSGRSRDPFVRVHGYMIFIKGVPDGEEERLMEVQITGIRPSCGFAQYLRSL